MLGCVILVDAPGKKEVRRKIIKSVSSTDFAENYVSRHAVMLQLFEMVYRRKN